MATGATAQATAVLALAALLVAANAQSINIDWSGGKPTLDIPDDAADEPVAQPSAEDRHEALLAKAVEIDRLEIDADEKMELLKREQEKMKRELEKELRGHEAERQRLLTLQARRAIREENDARQVTPPT